MSRTHSSSSLPQTRLFLMVVNLRDEKELKELGEGEGKGEGQGEGEGQGQGEKDHPLLAAGDPSTDTSTEEPQGTRAWAVAQCHRRSLLSAA